MENNGKSVYVRLHSWKRAGNYSRLLSRVNQTWNGQGKEKEKIIALDSVCSLCFMNILIIYYMYMCYFFASAENIAYVRVGAPWMPPLMPPPGLNNDGDEGIKYYNFIMCLYASVNSEFFSSQVGVSGDTNGDDSNDENSMDADIYDGIADDGASPLSPFHAALRAWVGEFNITLNALRALLSIVGTEFPECHLPKDPRTLMRTPRHLEITKLDDGAQYWYQGVAHCLERIFRNQPHDETIAMNVNVDGLPLYNSSNKCFWPILLNIHNRPEVKPFAAAVYYGDKKPASVDTFFRPFIDELKVLITDGLTVNGHRLTIKIRAFICDSPARAFIKGINTICSHLQFFFVYI